MKNNFKYTKQELSNFSDKENEGGSEGDTIDNKLEIIDKNLFGKHLKVFQGHSVEDAIKFFQHRREDKEICEHIANVLSYLNGDTKEKPDSLAVAHACQNLSGFSYSDGARVGVEAFVDQQIEDEELPSDDVDVLLADSSFVDDCVDWVADDCANGETYLDYLLGNAYDIDSVLDEDTDDIEMVNKLIIEKYVKEYLEDVLKEKLADADIVIHRDDYDDDEEDEDNY